MNSPMSVDVARKVTSRPEFVNAKDDYARVRAIYQVLFQRSPKPEEVKFAANFYDATVTQPGGPAVANANANNRNPAQNERERLREQRIKQRQAERMAQQKKAGDRQGKRPVRNEGEMVERKPLSVWEEYAQALLFTNELAYVN